jgi:hypothetical protein
MFLEQPVMVQLASGAWAKGRVTLLRPEVDEIGVTIPTDNHILVRSITGGKVRGLS